jgi:NTE family protein
MKKLTLVILLLLGTAACTTAPLGADRPPAKIALALGGGAARGFAHVGVIKALEAQGITADIVVGTSAGSVVGALHASGLNGFQIQELSMDMGVDQVLDGSGMYQCIAETMVSDKRGCIKGQALQDFVNKNVNNRPMEALDKTFAAVATNLSTGEMVVFRTGNTGKAVRASSSVPVFFEPVTINGKDYVDGGLVAPVPSSVARSMGADFVIAVNISDRPQDRSTAGITDILWQTFSIFGQTINQHEQSSADITIRPITLGLPSADVSGRNRAVLEGEKAVALILPELKAKLAELNKTRHVAGMP